MMKPKTIFYILVFICLTVDGVVVYYQPEQVHLAYGDDSNQMVVTWTTYNDTNSSVVEFGENELNLIEIGFRTLFVDGGTEQRRLYIHRVTLTDLEPGTKYWYHCGSSLGWSNLFYFKTPPVRQWSPSLAVYGDLGMDNAQSLSRLQDDVRRGMYDAILHIGDFAYDMDTDNARVGDQFMRQIEPIASLVPYMVCVGNHEQMYNFSNYKSRFSMPGDENSLMYSFNMGPIHFVAISTEFYYFTKYGMTQVIKQYEWLENDLKLANLPENRSKQPWIVTFGHRPMYCSNVRGRDCTKAEDLVRVGIPILHWFGLEKLFYDAGVDLEFWAHEHSYERLWPVYNRTVFNGSWEHPYTNPGAPVHITTGSAGCREKHTPFLPDRPLWTAFRSNDYGYSRLKAYNATHLYVEQVSDDQVGKIVDSVWIIKDKHGSYAG